MLCRSFKSWSEVTVQASVSDVFRAELTIWKLLNWPNLLFDLYLTVHCRSEKPSRSFSILFISCHIFQNFSIPYLSQDPQLTSINWISRSSYFEKGIKSWTQWVIEIREGKMFAKHLKDAKRHVFGICPFLNPSLRGRPNSLRNYLFKPLRAQTLAFSLDFIAFPTSTKEAPDTR